MKPIESKIDILQGIANTAVELLKGIQVVRKTADRELSEHGITPETEQAMSELMAQLHYNTARLHNGGHSLHQTMSGYAPFKDPNSLTIQSGNKEWPAQP